MGKLEANPPGRSTLILREYVMLVENCNQGGICGKWKWREHDRSRRSMTEVVGALRKWKGHEGGKANERH